MEITLRSVVSSALVEWDLTPRPASASSVTLIRQMDLSTANLLGNVHGGEIMKMVDTAGVEGR